MSSKENNFELGQIVFLITDPEQHERIITGILYRPGSIIYYLGYNDNESYHYEIEIATVKNWKK